MNVLVTNDDGFGAWGIESLCACLSKKHTVFVLAPDSDRSGNSAHLNLFKPLALKNAGENLWMCGGTPADCVNIALKGNLFPEKIDAVVSGINRGENLGTDIVYSGTCGAAKQAVLCGVPGIAASMVLSDPSKDWNRRENWNFDMLGTFVAENLEKLCALCTVSDGGHMSGEPCVFVNVNAPSVLKVTGAKMTDVCFKEYMNDRVSVEPASENMTVTFAGGPCSFKSRRYSDMDACREGFISVSRVYAEPRCPPPDSSLDCIAFSL